MPTLRLAQLIRRPSRANNVTVWLGRAAQEEIAEQITEAEPDETGGILLGYEVLASHSVVITHLVGPGPDANATRAHFDPDGRWQEKEVARIYEESGRHATYLGDWHSHPNGLAKPSRKDQRTARAIAKHRQARMPTPLMLIAVTSETGVHFASFRYTSGKLRRVSLRLYEAGSAETDQP